MSLPVQLDSGEEGEAVALQGVLLSVVVPRAFAPGAPIRFHARVGEQAVALTGKSIGSKRREDERFDVRMRLINLRKTDREALSAALA